MLIPSKFSGYRPDGVRLYPGGKGSDAPPPDPRLIEAQIKSMGIQDDAIQSVLKLSQDMQPLQREQMEFGLEAQRAAFNDARSDRGWAVGRRGELSGLQDRMISDAQSFDVQRRSGELAAEATAGVNSAFSNARDQSARAMARMGVNPFSGKAAAMNTQVGLAQASALAQAANKGRDAARAEGYALTDRASNALAGYPAMGMNATGAAAGFGGAGMTMANQGLAGMTAGMNAAGGMAGQMGQNATQMWNAQANYKANSDQDSGGLLGGIGALAGGIARIWPSDRRLKADVQRVGEHPLGIGLYEWTYTGAGLERHGPGRFRGVMADEVERVRPEAVTRDSNGFQMVNYAML